MGKSGKDGGTDDGAVTATAGVGRQIDTLGDTFEAAVRPVGALLVVIYHYFGLFLIGAATVWAAGWTFADLMKRPTHASIEDLLLLFIFLEVGAMVGIYFRTNHMPVRFLMYVAITAVTRHMIGVVNHVPVNVTELVAVAGTILILALALLAIRFGSYYFPAGEARAPSFKTDADRQD